jgi:hypothetical protein
VTIIVSSSPGNAFWYCSQPWQGRGPPWHHHPPVSHLHSLPGEIKGRSYFLCAVYSKQVAWALQEWPPQVKASVPRSSSVVRARLREGCTGAPGQKSRSCSPCALHFRALLTFRAILTCPVTIMWLVWLISHFLTHTYGCGWTLWLALTRTTSMTRYDSSYLVDSFWLPYISMYTSFWPCLRHGSLASSLPLPSAGPQACWGRCPQTPFFHNNTVLYFSMAFLNIYECNKSIYSTI